MSFLFRLTLAWSLDGPVYTPTSTRDVVRSPPSVGLGLASVRCVGDGGSPSVGSRCPSGSCTLAGVLLKVSVHRYGILDFDPAAPDKSVAVGIRGSRS